MISRKTAVWALAVIFIANFLNYMDRQLVSALEDPLRKDMKLRGDEFGLLWTLFTIGYMVCAVPIGLMADRLMRTRLFAGCIAVWSLATIASGLASSKAVLYIARVFIGVGEAGCLVIGPALISDYFTKQARGRVLSIFYLGLPLGGTAAFILAGLLLDDIGWRNMFFLAGAPGFVVAAIVWLMADPPRGAGEGAHHGVHGGGGAREYLALLKTPTLLLIILAQAFAVIILIPLIHFGVEFFVQSRGMKREEALITLGVMALIAGALGNSLSGVIGDWLDKRTEGAYALLAGIGFLAGWPCLLVGFFAEERWVFLPALTLGCFFYFLCMPAVNTQIANVASPSQRATAWALAVFILHLLGDTLAPPVFGWVSDRIPRALAFSIFSVSLVFAGICCLIAARTAPADVGRVAASVEQEERELEAHEHLGEPLA